MKRIHILLALFLCLSQLTWAQGSGEGYNPENPGDPNVYYNLLLEASPRMGGIVSPVNRQLGFGESASCSATAKTGYTFSRWMIGDSVVSTDSYFTYTMPDHDEVLTAYFEYTGYNPENPGDPFVGGYQHKVTLYANPSIGGSFNSSSFYMTEGETTRVYAYPRNGYRFESWMVDNTVVSTSNPMTIRMGQNNLSYTAVFAYNPENPNDPSANEYDVSTGKLVIDNFTPGSLNSAIRSAIGDYDNYATVRSITVIGQMTAEDFGFASNFSACDTVDLSRTTGYTEIPSYAFEAASSIKVIYFPLNVETVGRNAFYGCTGLRGLYMYTTTPPVLEESALSGLPSNVIIYVPAAAVPLFNSAEGWSNYQIRSLDSEEKTLTVNFPSGTNMSDYQNMTLELVNVQSNQVYRCLVTNRSTYTFFGLMKNSVYDLYLKTTDGVVLNKTEFINIEHDDVTVTMGAIAKQYNVEVRVLTPQGVDVTNDVAVTWLDADGTYIRQGNVMKNQLVGTNLSYQLKLSQSLAIEYVQPSRQNYVVINQNDIETITLQPIEKVTLTGKIKASNSKLGIYGANVSVVQTVNGKYSKTFTTQTDAKGLFSLQVYNVPASLVVSAIDYINKTVSVSEVNAIDSVAQIADIFLETVIGATINVNLTYTPSVTEGDTVVTQNWYSDYQNVEYSIFNITKQREITQISNRFPQLVVMDGAEIGDQLRLTATSKKDAFMPVMVNAIVDTLNHIDATFDIKQKGGIKIDYTTALNENNVAILYDAYGTFMQKRAFNSDGELTFEDLKDSQYTLVCMGESQYNSIYLLSRYAQTGLIENVDYVKDSVTTLSGVIGSITIPSIPELDEQKIQYFGEQSSFSVNKSSVVAGGSLTFTGIIDFNSVPDQLSNVRMVVDIPSSAEFVEHSVMIGQNVIDNYSLDGQQLTISLSNYRPGQSVKFCVVPKSSGKFSPNAYVGFSTSTKEYFLSIGSAIYEVDAFSFDMPNQTSRPRFNVMGCVAGTPQSTIEVYCNEQLVATTHPDMLGHWVAAVDLGEEIVNLTKYAIYVRYVSVEGVEVLSDIKNIVYDRNCIDVSKVTMYHYNPELGKTYSNVFDFQNPQNKPGSYVYYIYNEVFNFTISFTNNDPNLISKVKLYVKTGNGTWTPLSAKYDSNKQLWTAKGNFGNMYDGNIPLNVAVDFVADYEYLADRENLTFVVNTIDKLTQKQDFLIMDSLLASINQLIASERYEEADSLLSLISIEEMSLENVEDVTIDEAFAIADSLYESSQWLYPSDSICLVDDDGMHTFYTIKRLSVADVADLNIADWVAITLSDSSKVYYQATDQEIMFVDLTQMVCYSILSDGHSTRMRMPASAYDNIDGFLNHWNQLNTQLTLAQTNIVELIESTIRHFDRDLNNSLNALAKVERDIELYRNGEKEGKNFIELLLKQAKLKTEVAGFQKNIAALRGLFKFIDIVSIVNDIFKARESIQEWNEIIQVIESTDCPNMQQLAAQARKYQILVATGYDVNITTNVMALIGLCNIFKTSLAKIGAGWAMAIELAITDFSIIQGGINELNDMKWKGKIRSKIPALKNCNEKEDEEDEDEVPVETPKGKKSGNEDAKNSIDPSGYVYEAISSNRLEGVTATAYFMSINTDEYGVVQNIPMIWDASEYAQENPLFTDGDGKYQWYVPQGLWQVKFEKEGYETTYSEWLPVPPPQLDVNVAMKQYRQPEVKEAHAYKDGVDIEFDKYMLPSLLNTDNILVTANGAQISGTIQLLDEEVSYEGEETTYASLVRFVPNTPITAQQITLTVSNRVASYANVRMQDNYQQTFDIEQEVTSLLVDSLIKVNYGSSKTITVTALPASASAGRTLTVATGGSMIAGTDATSYVLDNRGQALVTISGGLPGTTGLTFAVEGTRLTANAMVQVNVASADTIFYTITATADHATVTGTGEYASGTTATLTVIPDDGYQFISWTDGDISNPRTIAVTSDADYEAIIEASDTRTKIIENTIPIVKQVFNGHIVIIRDGVRYNVLGSRL